MLCEISRIDCLNVFDESLALILRVLVSLSVLFHLVFKVPDLLVEGQVDCFQGADLVLQGTILLAQTRLRFLLSLQLLEKLLNLCLQFVDIVLPLRALALHLS